MADNTPDFAPPLAALAVQTAVTVANTGSGLSDIQKDGTTVDASTRSKLNFITGTGTTLTVADTPASDRVDVTIAANPTTYRKTTPKAVNTTVAATDLLNGEITVAAGAMGTTGALRLTAWGDWLQNIGTNQVPPRFQVLFGGTTMIDTGTLAGGILSSATRSNWRLAVVIQNSAANAQTVELDGKVWSDANTAGAQAFTTGTGLYVGLSTRIHLLAGVNSGLAVNTAIARALVLNVINGNAGALYETQLFGALAEVIL